MFAIRPAARATTRQVAARATAQVSAVARRVVAPVACAAAAPVRRFRSGAALRNAEEDEEEMSYNYMPPTYTSAAFVTQRAPTWQATALVNGKFQQLSSSDYAGKWHVLFFYPLDFTFVCPTEIRAFSDRVEEFRKIGVEVIAASVDSEYSHLAWTKQDRKEGGLGEMKIPILADITKTISRDFGVLLEDKGIALRGLFIIDPQGILRQSTINDLPVGRSVDETLRLLQAFQFHEKHGEVCPAGWTPGGESMKADESGLKAYFAKKQ